MKNNIKLVIWDLDDTLWRGSLAEGADIYPIKNRFDIIRALNRRGIVNSICSKNDFIRAKTILKKFGMWEEFVFPKIEFSPKGKLIADTLKEMHLRAENTLFIDDNSSNLQEAAYYNKGLNILIEEHCDDILDSEYCCGKDDSSLTRLKQYRQLEKKSAAQKSANSNIEFLRNSNIKVELIEYADNFFERVYELSERTNQLNFTKNRMTEGQLQEFLNRSSVTTKLVYVTDAFGDYGIVGFYSLTNDRLIHFVFSCRIMNMGVEQFVYELLNYPQLTIVGETASNVEKNDAKIDYITLTNSANIDDSVSIGDVIDKASRIKIFAIGACDLYRTMSFFEMPNQDFCYECNVFMGNERGVNVGTEYIRSQMDMNDDEKAYCQRHFHNYKRNNVFHSMIYEKTWDYVIMSFHDDMIFKIYHKKDNRNLRVLLSPAPIFGATSVININEGTANFDEQQEWLKTNFSKGEYITVDRFIDNLLFIADKLPNHTKFILVTAPELNFFRTEHFECQEVRQQILKLNRAIFDLVKLRPEKFLAVDINSVVKSKDDVTNYVFHLKPEISYKLFENIVKEIIKDGSMRLNMLNGVLGGRLPIVFGNGIQAKNAVYNLMMGNCVPDAIIHFKDIGDNIAGYVVEDFCHYTDKDKFFVVVADDENYVDIHNRLTKMNFIPGQDFVKWTATTDRVHWRDD